MATTSTQGARRRSVMPGKYRLRSYAAAVACSTALSTVATTAPAVAQEKEPAAVIQELARAASTGDVAGLAGALADIQGQVTDLEAQIGQQREAVNRALVDLQDARTELKQAQQGTSTARGQLDEAQKAVEAAQAKLDELSRVAYRRASTSESITNAAGGDARSAMLERQAFLRGQAEDQKAVVEQLEKERTDKANKESQLRKTEQLAQERQHRAEAAEQDARTLLAQSQLEIDTAMGQREELLKQQQIAQAALDKARGVAGDGGKTDGAARSNVVAAQPLAGAVGAPVNSGQATGTTTAHQDSAGSATATTETTAASESQTASATGASAAATESMEIANDSATPESTTRSTMAATGADVPPAQSSSVDPAGAAAPAVDAIAQGSSNGDQQQLLAAGATAFGAAAALVAASQPNHADLDGGVESGSSESDLKALQNVLDVVSGAMGVEGTATSTASNRTGSGSTSGAATTSTGSDDSDLVGQLGDVLGLLDTAQTVTERASSLVKGQSTNAQIEAVIARAESQIGVPYAWGGGDANGPTKGIHDGGVADSFGDFNKVGFDCSGLTLYAFAAAGISLPHYTGYQYNYGTKVDPSEMQRGDLIFYGPGGSQHVAIYLGDGTMIEAPESGSTVQISPVRQSGMSPQVVRLID